MSGWNQEKQQREDMNRKRLEDEEKVRQWFAKKEAIEREIRERQRRADEELRRMADEKARLTRKPGRIKQVGSGVGAKNDPLSLQHHRCRRRRHHRRRRRSFRSLHRLACLDDLVNFK